MPYDTDPDTSDPLTDLRKATLEELPELWRTSQSKIEELLSQCGAHPTIITQLVDGAVLETIKACEFAQSLGVNWRDLDPDTGKVIGGKRTSWPLHIVVWRLANAVDHLLHDHDCDAHGHEGVLYAMRAAREWLDRIPNRMSHLPHYSSGSDCHTELSSGSIDTPTLDIEDLYAKALEFDCPVCDAKASETCSDHANRTCLKRVKKAADSLRVRIG